jgi:hypothetical protein
VRVNEGDSLAEDDGAEIGQECEEVWQCGGRYEGGERYVIDLQSRHKPAYANAVGWMAVCDDYDLSELNCQKQLDKKLATLWPLRMREALSM